MNLLGASIPLHAHCLGCVVADCTAQPSMEVGVVFIGEDDAGRVPAGSREMEPAAVLGRAAEGGGRL